VTDQTLSVTTLLRAWRAGDLEARDRLLGVVYHELRAQAARFLRQERRNHTLQPTAVVHEAYLRLVGQERVSWQNRAQFFGLAAQMMRRILVDHARPHRAAKRPGGGLRIPWDERVGATQPADCDLPLLDQALAELTAIDPRQVRIVELRYFGDLQQVAEMLAVSRATVTREWRSARAWLFHRMTHGPADRRHD
jgi:RNA polymerase sigma-70 factor, ECF subfamily